jgi:hypothetical protein
MIIAVSIVDKHKPEGERHVGTYMFEIDYPPDTHFDFMVVSSKPGQEAITEHMKPFLNRLLSRDEVPDAIQGDGSDTRSFPGRKRKARDAN